MRRKVGYAIASQCFTDTGRVFRLKVYQIPEATRTSRGRAIVNLLNLKDGENIVTFRSIKDFDTCQDNLVFATSMGRVKRTAVAEYRNVNSGGIHAIRLNDDDCLVDVIKTDGTCHVLMGTAQGMSIRFAETDARLMGRTAAGVKVTLRSNKMYEFIDRLVNIALPRIKDFKGLSLNGFDKFSNYSLGIKEHIIFPEINFDKVDRIRGLDVTIVTNSKGKESALALLEAMNFPFIKKTKEKNN